MKILKWFRYGFLILGFLFLLETLCNIFSFGEYVSAQFFVASALFFIIYAIVRIIELCKSKNKFEPLIIYYSGFILACIAYSDFATHSPTYYLLEQPLSGKLTPFTKEAITWGYFILTTLLLIIGVTLELIKVCKKISNDSQKTSSLSNVIWSIGMSFVWIRIIWLLFSFIDYMNYVNRVNSGFGLIFDVTKLLFYVSIPLLITGCVLRVIYIIKNIKNRSVTIEKK